MNDLLGTVKGKNPLSNGRGRGDEDDVEVDEIDEEEGIAPPQTEAEREMQVFFKAIESIKIDFAQIRTAQKEIVALHEKGKSIVKSKETQKHRELLQDMINAVNKTAHVLKGKLEALDKENEIAKKKKGQGEGSASERTRTTITAGLKKKLKEAMQEFSDLRNRITAEYREVVERRVYTVTGTVPTAEDVDHLIETGEGEAIFKKAILEQGRGRVLDTLAEIQERHRAVKDLEQSLLELHQLFMDMAVLVEAQGEMLDNIEKQVQRSVNAVKGGTEALQGAKELQKNTRKWMCCAIIIMLIVALVIVLAVVRPWKYLK